MAFRRQTPSKGFGSSNTLSRANSGRTSRTPSKGFGSSVGLSRTTSGRTSRTPLRQSRLSNRNTLDGRNSRGSLLKGASDSQFVKDPRDLKSKAWQSSAISYLIDFLAKKGFNQSLSRKVLSSPSTREFKMIFEFMVRQLTPQYTLGATDLKLEQEVHNVFRDLGYNYMLNKQHLATVGAPHSWPYALGALDWLREAIEIEDAIEYSEDDGDQSSSFNDFKTQDSEIQRLFIREEARGYAEYLATGNEPNHEEFAGELDRIMLDGFQEPDLLALQEEITKLHQALEELQPLDDNVHEICAELDEKLMEEHHLMEQQVALDTEMEGIVAQAREAEEVTEAAHTRRQSVEAKIVEVQALVDKQPMRREDVEELLNRRNNSKAELEYQGRVNIDILESNGVLERQMAGMISAIEPKAISLVHLANELGVLQQHPDLQIGVLQFQQADSFIPQVTEVVAEIEERFRTEKENLKSVLHMEQRLAKQVTEELRRASVLDQSNRQQLRILDERLERVQERVQEQEKDIAAKRLTMEREMMQLQETSLVKEKELRAAADCVRRSEETLKFRDAELASKISSLEKECREVTKDIKRALALSADFGTHLMEVAVSLTKAKQ